MGNFIAVIALSIMVLLSGCATVYNPATQQEEFIFIDTGSEVSLGRNIDYQISKTYYIVKEPAVNERVNTIGGKIAGVCDRQDLKYHFQVIKDKEVNAFSTPGGYVYVNTGLLDKVSDDELACVLGHEVGHIAARHVVKKLQVQMGYDLLMSLAFEKGGAKGIEEAMDVTFNIISLGYSREDELLADRLAIRYAYKAGYNPEAIITFFKKLQDLKKEKGFATPLFLRSHPYLEQRIDRAKEEIAALKGTASPAASSPSIMPAYTKEPSKKDLEPQTEPPSPSYGFYKVCPQCGHTYPRSYQYCPNDGTKLKY